MKKYQFVILTLILCTIRVSSQTLNPQPLDFGTNANIVIAPTQSKFLLGWNHGDSPSKSLSTALKMNVWYYVKKKQR